MALARERRLVGEDNTDGCNQGHFSMKHTKCKICGKEHALGGCPEFQSTAARKDVHVQDTVKTGDVGLATIPSPRSVEGIDRPRPGPSRYQALPVDTTIDACTSSIIQKHKERLAYQAQYQRDLRAATKLGISVKEFRAAKGKEE